MTDDTQTPAAPPRAKRTRKPRTPAGPRNVDPAVKAIYDEARQKVAEHRKAAASAGILKTIIENRLPKLTQEHRQQLYEALAKICTPTLPNV